MKKRTNKKPGNILPDFLFVLYLGLCKARAAEFGSSQIAKEKKLSMGCIFVDLSLIALMDY